MRIPIFALAKVLLLGVACAGTNQPQNALQPFTFSFDRDLRPILEKKLLVTDGNFGRMVELPASPVRGESAVSVYCRGGHYFVTSTRANANLDYIVSATTRRNRFASASRVAVRRKNAEIGESTASDVRAAWQRMLANVKPPPPDGPTVLDVDRFEFWLRAANGSWIKAEAPDERGESVDDLITIGHLLSSYCEAPKNHREQIAMQISGAARRLLARE